MRIDVHHHIVPPRFAKKQRDEILSYSGNPSLLAWSPAQSLEAMEQAGIAKAYTSLGVPGAPDVRLARHCNEYAAELARTHPGRFGTFAALPLPDVDASLAELAYALDELGADGVALLTTYGDRRLGDPHFAPLFDELHARRAVAHVHPTAPAACRGLIPGYPDPFLEFPFDTTRAVASLIYGGTLTRCPDLTLILSHGGGAIPMLAQRLGAFAQMQGGVPDVAYELSRLYVDAVTVTNPPAFAATSGLLSTDRILFGTDLPFVPAAVTTDGLDALGLGAAAVHAIEHGNAERILTASGG